MSLPQGTRLGPYEILAPLGAGGMGEVYRSRDSRLGRDVAVKILPPDFRTDPERLTRFAQEARAAAALNHPNILAVHDVGEHNGQPYIVAELLDGETLRAELATRSDRRLPTRKAIDYAVQLARGLAAAHDRGIFVTPDGRIKILDFGLAKLAQPEPAHTATGGLETTPGLVMGTVGYMAPEQVRGQPVDHRADIFAFGATLYEMLAGRRAFEGQSAADTMSAILANQPTSLPTIDPLVGASLARIVDRCLEKNPGARFQSAHDLGFALEGVSSSSDAKLVAAPRRRRVLSWLPWALATAATLALIATAWWAVSVANRPRDAMQPVRYYVQSPGGATSFTSSANSIALSPDGRQLVFVGADSAGAPMLWLQPLDALTARPIPGTEGARLPFWSPDSRHIAFFGVGTLRRVPAAGGLPQTILDTTAVATGGTWNQDGVILFSAFSGPIRRVPAGGSTFVAETVLNAAHQDETHSFPQFLPDGKRFLFHVRSQAGNRNGIYVKSLDSDEIRLVVNASSNVVYDPSGHILYGRNGILVAQPFDVQRAVTTGDPVPIAEPVTQFPELGLTVFSASDTGVLTYRGSADSSISRLLWFDRNGNRIGEIGEPRSYRNPRLSPDDTQVAVELIDRSGNRDIWLMDVARGVPKRFTFGPGRDAAPVWSPDGQKIAWQGNAEMYSKAANGAGGDERLRNEPWIPDDWRDGTLFCHPIAPRQILALTVAGAERTPQPVVEGRTITTHARLSPDAQWIAFASNDSGRMEVYLQKYPKGDGWTLLSANGGLQPKWSRDGKELFYLALDGNIMAVSLTLGTLVEIGKPRRLFQTRIDSSTGVIWHQYDLSRDGKRFLVNTPEATTIAVTVVLNWPALLRQ
jgi:eukaryotic-like serine/threonine-protein kinase